VNANSSEAQQSSNTASGSSSSSATKANFQIPPPDILELEGSTASNWCTWLSAWNNYTLLTKLDKEEGARQVATLLAVIGKETPRKSNQF